MRLQLRKYKDLNADGGIRYSLSAFDSAGKCHIDKPIDADEFDHTLAWYMDNNFDVLLKDDHGQSDELYKILID